MSTSKYKRQGTNKTSSPLKRSVFPILVPALYRTSPEIKEVAKKRHLLHTKESYTQNMDFTSTPVRTS